MWATFDKPVLVERVDDESDVWARGLTELCELIMRQGFGGATEVRTLSRPAAEAKRFVKVAVSCSHRRTVASPSRRSEEPARTTRPSRAAGGGLPRDRIESSIGPSRSVFDRAHGPDLGRGPDQQRAGAPRAVVRAEPDCRKRLRAREVPGLGLEAERSVARGRCVDSVAQSDRPVSNPCRLVMRRNPTGVGISPVSAGSGQNYPSSHMAEPLPTDPTDPAEPVPDAVPSHPHGAL
jgi:hypothetical protein